MSAANKSLCSKLVSTILISFLLYGGALALRLQRIAYDETSPDELHWLSRSYEIIKKYERGDYTTLTTHLDHPGVPPALLMALSMKVVKKYLGIPTTGEGENAHYDRLIPARVSVALVSALAIPLLFLGARAWLGAWPAFFAALVLLLDPIHIGLSRQAHLDSILTLFIMAAVLLFVHAELKPNAWWARLLAGVFWGLALATKFTALAFVIGLIAYRLLRFVLVWVKERRLVTLVSWADVFAVFLGHATMALIYTRMWAHRYGVAEMRHVQNRWATWSEHFALWINQPSLWSVSLLSISLLLVLAALIGCYQERLARTRNLPFRLLAAAGFVVLVHYFSPAFFDNFISFYTRAGQLKDVSHLAYGVVRPRVPYGYLTICFCRLTEVVQLGVFLGLVALYWEAKKERLLTQKFWGSFLVLTVFFVWAGILNLSAKQTIRYLMPVTALLDLVVGFGWFWLAGALAHKIGYRSEIVKRWIYLFTIGLALSFQVYAFRVVYPYYMIYYSKISGGLKAAYGRNLSVLSVGTVDVLEFMSRNQHHIDASRTVRVIGDLEIFQNTVGRLFPQLNYKFVSQMGEAQGHYLIVLWPYFRAMDEHYRSVVLETDLARGKKVFELGYRDEAFATLYRFPLSDLDKPQTRSFADLSRSHGVGKVVYYRDGKVGDKGEGTALVSLMPGRDNKGFAARNYDIMIRPGKFKLRVLMGLVPGAEYAADLTAERFALRLEMSKSCQRVVTFGELSKDEMRWVELECDNDVARDYQLRAYWWGNVPLLLQEFQIVSAQ